MLLVIPHPAVKFRADALKVLVLGSLLARTDRLGMASAEPVLEEVSARS